VAEVLVGLQPADREALGPQLEVPRHVLAIVRLGGLPPRRLQRAAGQRLGVEPVGEAAQPEAQRVRRRDRGVVESLRRAQHDEPVDQLGVDERAVRRDPHDHVRRRAVGGGAEPVEHVGLAAPGAAHALALGQVRDRVVAREVRRGDDHVVERRRAPRPLDHEREQRPSAEIGEHLARPPAGAHPGLHDADGSRPHGPKVPLRAQP
jgi:hypothetical protein